MSVISGIVYVIIMIVVIVMAIVAFVLFLLMIYNYVQSIKDKMRRKKGGSAQERQY